MNGHDVKWIRESLGISVDEFSRLLAVHRTSIFGWQREGDGPIQAKGHTRNILDALHEALKGDKASEFRDRLLRLQQMKTPMACVAFISGWIEHRLSPVMAGSKG